MWKIKKNLVQSTQRRALTGFWSERQVAVLGNALFLALPCWLHFSTHTGGSLFHTWTPLKGLHSLICTCANVRSCVVNTDQGFFISLLLSACHYSKKGTMQILRCVTLKADTKEKHHIKKKKSINGSKPLRLSSTDTHKM